MYYFQLLEKVNFELIEIQTFYERMKCSQREQWKTDCKYSSDAKNLKGTHMSMLL